jgi:hypothetical protein
MRLRTLLSPALAAFPLLAACDGGTGSTEAGGEYIAALETPDGRPEGALLVELTGEGIADVHAASLALFEQPVSGGRRLMLIREPAGRIDFRVRMAPGSAPPAVRVLEVVGPDDLPRASVDGYSVSFTRTRGDQ